MVVDITLRVIAHQDLGASHFLLTLGTEGRVPAWTPGQFAMITLGQPGATSDPLLRRPFSIFNLFDPAAGSLQIFYKVLGRGTRILSAARPGDHLSCLAPLGNGFAPRRGPGSRLLLVAGGIGSASLHPLALSEVRAGGKPVILYGCRTRDDLAGIRPTQEAGVECLVATDDGSAGRPGRVGELLDEFLGAGGAGPSSGWVICACGPHMMMKATADVAARRGVACHLSLESPMACGFGVCVGCVTGFREAPGAPLTYRRICVDGPVFDAAQVCW